MFTSRAEFRLFLRQDNADQRLFKHAYKYGLISKEEISRAEEKSKEIKRLNEYVKTNKISVSQFNKLYNGISSTINHPQQLSLIIKRPEVGLEKLLNELKKEFFEDAIKEVEYNIKYEGYLKRNLEQIKKFKDQEKRKLSKQINYQKIESLSLEARDKLNQIQPDSLGQASRISGVSPADISVLMIYLEREKHTQKVPRETRQKSN